MACVAPAVGRVRRRLSLTTLADFRLACATPHARSPPPRSDRSASNEPPKRGMGGVCGGSWGCGIDFCCFFFTSKARSSFRGAPQVRSGIQGQRPPLFHPLGSGFSLREPRNDEREVCVTIALHPATDRCVGSSAIRITVLVALFTLILDHRQHHECESGHRCEFSSRHPYHRSAQRNASSSQCAEV
jgi:hypothetical protein